MTLVGKGHLVSAPSTQPGEADGSFSFFISGSKTLISEDELRQTFLKLQDPRAGKGEKKKVNRVWIKARAQRLLKFRATVSCLYPTAEGMPTIYIPTLSQ